MNQVDLKENGCDFFINTTDRDIEVYFPCYVEIDEAIKRAIQVARELQCNVILVFNERKFSINPKTRLVDVLETYIFN